MGLGAQKSLIVPVPRHLCCLIVHNWILAVIVTLSPFCVFSGAEWSEGEVESRCSDSGTGGGRLGLFFLTLHRDLLLNLVN